MHRKNEYFVVGMTQRVGRYLNLLFLCPPGPQQQARFEYTYEVDFYSFPQLVMNFKTGSRVERHILTTTQSSPFKRQIIFTSVTVPNQDFFFRFVSHANYTKSSLQN